MILVALDTSALVGSINEARVGWQRLRALVESGEPLKISSLVLYEWLRGPRTQAELDLRLSIFPDDAVLAYTAEDAALSAELYCLLPKARARSVDIGIAACCLRHQARLWTLNRKDFEDIPGLVLLH